MGRHSTEAPRPHDLDFTVGSRRVASVRRKLVQVAFSLGDALSGRLPEQIDLSQAQGLRVLSAPVDMIEAIRAQYPECIMGPARRYRRAFITMGTFEGYLASFSGKTRATLRRKGRKMEAASEGSLDVREYLTPTDLAEFFELAIPLSEATYQARLLDAGLPTDQEWLDEAMVLASKDRVRAFLLCLKGVPIAYLYLPIVDETLIYAYLGYDRQFAALSPGTVLQMAALERLFGEQRFRYFDFTEGDGPHKALFATDGIECASFLLLKATAANRALIAALFAFDAAVEAVKRLSSRLGLTGKLRRLVSS